MPLGKGIQELIWMDFGGKEEDNLFPGPSTLARLEGFVNEKLHPAGSTLPFLKFSLRPFAILNFFF